MEEPPLRDLVAERFVVVHVDVGKWDRNMDIVEAWGDPTGHGIPSLAVARADRQILFVTKQGEISRVRRMGDDEVLEFFRLLAELG
jgi:protein disulfide-isomerase